MRAALAARDVGPMFELLKAAGVSQRQIGEYTQQSQSEISEIHTVQAPGVPRLQWGSRNNLFAIQNVKAGAGFAHQEAEDNGWDHQLLPWRSRPGVRLRHGFSTNS